ncbi:MAG: hypothetical protein GEU93_00610 [Propionibacteriales bacterium]|nr:hypothetical protein [Propionibacteriales bacterium]
MFDRADVDPKVTRLGRGVGTTIRYGEHDSSRAIVLHHFDQANRPIFVYRDEDHRSLYFRTLIVKEGRCA